MTTVSGTGSIFTDFGKFMYDRLQGEGSKSASVVLVLFLEVQIYEKQKHLFR